jgi:type II secretory pathway pseudopilin PulG
MRRRQTETSDEGGFTLIELVIVTAVMPIVIGALAVGILSVLSLNTSVGNRLTDAADAQIISVNFQNDVQTATQLTTASTPNPAACGSGFQILGLQFGDQSETSYTTEQSADGKTNDMFRNQCTGGTVTSSQLVAHDVPASMLSSSPVTVTCASASTEACVPGDQNTQAYQNIWVSTAGVTKVTFQATVFPGSSFTFQAVGVPAAGSNSANLTPPPAQNTGCTFATPGTTNNTSLCFVNFQPWENLAVPGSTGPPSNSNCSSGQLYVSALITGTAFVLSFCMSVTPPNTNELGYTPGPGNGNACTPSNNGYNNIAAVPMPTYSCPPDSESFLGNNGFYTGVAGDPALYTVNSGTTTINFTSIQVMTTGGSPATNWKLATGDAESTDPRESITWTTNGPTLSLINNFANSPVGNACDSTPPGINTGSLTGLNPPSSSVMCKATNSADHTGTVMLQATTPSSLTVQLVAGGLQAIFLGVLLGASP